MGEPEADTGSKLSRRGLLKAGAYGLAAVAGGGLAIGMAGPAQANQEQWKWCRRCEGLFFDGYTRKESYCPEPVPTGTGVGLIEPHDGSKSGNYHIKVASDGGHGQDGWTYCSLCRGMHFHPAGSDRWGSCPRYLGLFGHSDQPSWPYRIETDDNKDDWGPGYEQDNWRWCHFCEGLWYNGHAGFGTCPATTSGHSYFSSSNYVLRWTPGA